jgi:hypothetical protein
MTVRGLGPHQTYFPYQLNKIERIRVLLAEHDSRVLEMEAEKWGIEIASNDAKPEWYSEKTKNPYPDRIGGDTINVVREYLNEKGRTMVAKQIRDARRANVKWWIEVLIPVMALIVAIGAVFKDIIVEAIKRH